MSDSFYENLLTQTCTLKSRSYNVSNIDSWGVPVETVTTSSSTVPCLIQQNNETVEITVEGKKELATHIGFFLSATSIGLDDIIEISGVSYQVIGVDDPMAQEHHKEVLLKKIENK